MVQKLEEITTFVKTSSLVPSTSMAANNHLQLQREKKTSLKVYFQNYPSIPHKRVHFL